MSSYEQKLVDVAAGSGWELPSLPQLSGALQNYRTRVQKLEAEISNGAWTGYAAETASAHLRAMVKTFENAHEWVNEVSQLISGANSDIREYANRRLDALPSGDLPTAVWDAFSQGKFETLAGYGFSAVSKGPAGIAQLNAHFVAAREQAAADAAEAVQVMIKARAEEVKKRVEVGFDRVDPELPSPPGGDDSGSTQPHGGPRAPGAGTGPGAQSPGGWTPPGSGGPGSSGPGGSGEGSGPGGVGTGPGSQNPPGTDGPRDPNKPPYDPDWPHVIADPPVVNPDRPGSDVPDGDDGQWTDTGRRPSVDSSLESSAVRSGLGAAGLGAAGLAAGAKLAGGGGGGVGSGGGGFGVGLGAGAVGPGGLGAAGGPGAGGGGLRGAAAAAGSGSGSGASNASSNTLGAGRGARPGGMMMGGGAGGAAEKKSPKSGLGGYIAPKLEDEGDGGPAARASRAGHRLTEE